MRNVYRLFSSLKAFLSAQLREATVGRNEKKSALGCFSWKVIFRRARYFTRQELDQKTQCKNAETLLFVTY